MLSKDTLILLEESINGFDELAIKYSFISENKYQEAIPLTPKMLILTGHDTIYIENEKVHAHFENVESFSNFLSRDLFNYCPSQDNYFFVATFLVTSEGSIDSIRIFKSINKAFDE